MIPSVAWKRQASRQYPVQVEPAPIPSATGAWANLNRRGRLTAQRCGRDSALAFALRWRSFSESPLFHFDPLPADLQWLPTVPDCLQLR